MPSRNSTAVLIFTPCTIFHILRLHRNWKLLNLWKRIHSLFYVVWVKIILQWPRMFQFSLKKEMIKYLYMLMLCATARYFKISHFYIIRIYPLSAEFIWKIKYTSKYTGVIKIGLLELILSTERQFLRAFSPSWHSRTRPSRLRSAITLRRRTCSCSVHFSMSLRSGRCTACFPTVRICVKFWATQASIASGAP